MGKTKDHIIRQRILNDELVKASVIDRCRKARNSYQCKYDGKCFKNFGDALDAVTYVKEVTIFLTLY